MEEPRWTQDEAIAFEAACDCLNHWKAICVAALHVQERQARHDGNRILELQDELARVGDRRRALTVADHHAVAEVRAEYGRRVREHLARTPNSEGVGQGRDRRPQRSAATGEHRTGEDHGEANP